MIGPPGRAGDGVRVAWFVNDVEGWNIATLAFIVGREVVAGVVITVVGLDTLNNCGAAARLALEATCSADEDKACAGDTIAVGCSETGWSREVPVSTFLIVDLFAILPDFTVEPLALEETEWSVRPDNPGAVTLQTTEPRASDAVAAAGDVTVTGARGTAFSSETVAAAGVVT